MAGSCFGGVVSGKSSSSRQGNQGRHSNRNEWNVQHYFRHEYQNSQECRTDSWESLWAGLVSSIRSLAPSLTMSSRLWLVFREPHTNELRVSSRNFNFFFESSYLPFFKLFHTRRCPQPMPHQTCLHQRMMTCIKRRVPWIAI